MDMSYTPEQVAFREEVRAWIAEAMPADIKQKADDFRDFTNQEIMAWHKVLAEKGWVAPNWPKEHGGTGWDVTQRSIFSEESAAANAPSLSPFGIAMVGPLRDPGGLAFRYMDGTGAVTAVGADIRQVEVALRTQSKARGSDGQPVSDSLVTRIYLRN